MHQQEVGGVLLLAHHLGHTGGHGDGGHAGGADEGIHLASGGKVHHVAENHAAGGGQAEGEQAQEDDLQGILGKEAVVGGLEANRQAQSDGNDVHQGVLGGVGQTVAHAALPEQVAQHEHADQRSGVGHQQNHEDCNQNGENDLFRFGDRTELRHLDLAHLFGGEQLHNGGLDQRDQGHIRVSRDGNGREQVRCQFRGRQNSRGAVRAADDADGRRLAGLKAQSQSHQEGGEDAQLSGSAQQQGHGIGQQGAEVRHCADSHKDNRRVDGVLNALINHPHEANTARMADCIIHRLVKQAGQRKVGQKHAKRNGN